MITVYVVDDRELVRLGLCHVIAEAENIEVVGEASTVAQALREVDILRPDLALIDIDLQNGLALEFCEHLAESGSPTQVLVAARDPQQDRVGLAMLAGASGYVLAADSGAEIVSRIRETFDHGAALDLEIVGDLFDRVRSGQAAPDDPLSGLTDREREILSLLAEGLDNRRIGDSLHLSPKTVKNYVSAILKKLGMANRTEAAVYAARQAALAESSI